MRRWLEIRIKAGGRDQARPEPGLREQLARVVRAWEGDDRDALRQEIAAAALLLEEK